MVVSGFICDAPQKRALGLGPRVRQGARSALRPALGLSALPDLQVEGEGDRNEATREGGQEMAGTTLETLTTEECYRLLYDNAASVGRVGVSVQAIPEILPVHFAIIDGDIVFRSGRGTKLYTATQSAVLAFELDQSDSFSGWSVLVVGRSAEVTDPSKIAAAMAVIPDGWVSGEHEHIIQIKPSRVTGRRITRDV